MKKLWRVGILGAGYIADWHLKALKGISSAKVSAICDVDLARATELKNRSDAAHAFGSLDELIASKTCDAVHILLPPDLHATAAVKLLDSGHKVFLEKPVCVTLEECETLQNYPHAATSLGVGHNFLFADPYVKLRDDIRAGKLGQLSEINISWHKELGQLRGGPFGIWMLRGAGNILLEIGPHSLAHLLDLMGYPDSFTVVPSHEIELPTGVEFFRRWTIVANKGATSAVVNFSFGRGFTEHAISVRGSAGVGHIDFEAGTYTLSRLSTRPMDIDRYRITREAAKSSAKQARAKLLRYVFSKAKLTRRGNDFGNSIQNAIRHFYDGLLNQRIDERLSIGLACNTIQLGHAIANQAGHPITSQRPAPRTTPLQGTTPKVLVFGGTGFIGQALVEKLVEAGHAVRLVARDVTSLPKRLQKLPLEIVRADLSKPDDLEKVCAGIEVIYHLARAHVKTWEEYEAKEIQATLTLAEIASKVGVKQFIYTGTIDSYFAGKASQTIIDETPLDPKIDGRNLYAKAKAISEQKLQQMQQSGKLPLVIFRPGIVLGSGGSPFHWGVGMWAGDSVVRTWGAGKHPMPFVLATDVADALVKALGNPQTIGKVFNLVGPPLLSGQEYLAELSKATQTQFDAQPKSILSFYLGDMFKYAIKVLVRHAGRRRPRYRDWLSRTQASPMQSPNAKNILGWNPVSDKQEFIEKGIVIPAKEWIG